MTTRLRDRSAIRWGVPLGVGLGLLGAVLTILMITGHDVALGGWLGTVQFVIVGAAFVAAGWRVGRLTTNVTQASLTGLIVGVVAAFLGGFTDFVLSLVAPGPYAHLVAGFDKLGGQPLALAGTIFAALLLNLMQYGIFGAALGALGGLADTTRIGARRRADHARTR